VSKKPGRGSPVDVPPDNLDPGSLQRSILKVSSLSDYRLPTQFWRPKCLFQYILPSGSMKKYGLKTFFSRAELRFAKRGLLGTKRGKSCNRLYQKAFVDFPHFPPQFLPQVIHKIST